MDSTSIKELLWPYGEGLCPGCALSIINNGKIVFSYVGGYADLEAGIKVDPNTDFRLCSVTKEFTAAAIMILIEKKELSFDNKLSQFFPDFPKYGRDISIYQLLTHSSGLIDYEELIPKSETEQIHDEGVLALLQKEQKGYFIPGSSYRYSNGGYCLLRLIVERKSGDKFSHFLKKHIFDPLGMRGTLIDEEGTTIIPRRAYGYSEINNAWTRTDQDLTSATIGDGGEYSSINDLYKWDQALYGEKIISQQGIDKMLHRNILTDEELSGVYYGLGFFIKDYRGEKAVYHGGSSVGFRTGIYRIPAKSLSVIFLSNRNEGDGSLLCEKIMDIVLKDFTPVPDENL